MSAVVTAVFGDHQTAERVRTQLVKEGFPTDRVELTSREELGQAKVVPAPGIAEKLSHYFSQLFPDEGEQQGAVQSLQRAVLDGRAVIAVQPRGEIETGRAVEILSQGGPVEFKANDLDNQSLEHAASEQEAPALSWIGKILVAPGTH